MLRYNEINSIVEGLAARTLGTANVVRCFSEPGTDADGNEIVRVTIVLAAGAVDRADDDALVSTLVEINKQLRVSGEERQSVLFFATEEELAASGDPEP